MISDLKVIFFIMDFMLFLRQLLSVFGLLWFCVSDLVLLLLIC
jgi:hypothetical protein